MKKVLILFGLCLACTSCQTWLALLQNPKTEEAIEESEEVILEAAAVLTGENAKVVVDINPTTHNKCYECPIHCPKPKPQDDPKKDVQ